MGRRSKNDGNGLILLAAFIGGPIWLYQTIGFAWFLGGIGSIVISFIAWHIWKHVNHKRLMAEREARSQGLWQTSTAHIKGEDDPSD